MTPQTPSLTMLDSGLQSSGGEDRESHAADGGMRPISHQHHSIGKVPRGTGGWRAWHGMARWVVWAWGQGGAEVLIFLN